MKTFYKIIFVLILFNILMVFYFRTLNTEVELQNSIIKLYVDKDLKSKKIYKDFLANEINLRKPREEYEENTDSLSILISSMKTQYNDSLDITFRLFHNINTSYNEVYVNGELVEEQYFPHKYNKEISDIDVAIINPVEGGSTIKLKYEE